MNEIKGKSEKAQDIKTDFVAYIKERLKEKQQLLSNVCRKNQKLLDGPVHRKKGTFTKSSLAPLAMKNSSQQLETNTNELTKFRSNTK